MEALILDWKKTRSGGKSQWVLNYRKGKQPQRPTFTLKLDIYLEEICPNPVSQDSGCREDDNQVEATKGHTYNRIVRAKS